MGKLHLRWGAQGHLNPHGAFRLEDNTEMVALESDHFIFNIASAHLIPSDSLDSQHDHIII